MQLLTDLLLKRIAKIQTILVYLTLWNLLLTITVVALALYVIYGKGV